MNHRGQNHPRPARKRGRSGPVTQDIDRRLGEALRRRRIGRGMSQQQAAELMGVTYQQARKYEKGINRLAAGRLYSFARALGMTVGEVFQEAELIGHEDKALDGSQKRLLQFTMAFVAIPSRDHQQALAHMARALAGE